MDPASIKALTFDVFGTVVDWRGSVIRECRAFGRARGIDADWERFADAWRGLYQPAMEEVRSGRRPWTKLDDLHRESLVRLLGEFNVTGVSDVEIDDLNRAWHRLDPWPDAVEGLTRLKLKYIIATLSNGNIALIVDMAKRAGLPWDAILGGDVVQRYKPQPEAYTLSAERLGLRPEQCMMVAAHAGDLRSARGCGLATAFVHRPLEHGPGAATDTASEGDFDVVASDFVDLALKLGC
jgi:2-haloacid dehalogenase